MGKARLRNEASSTIFFNLLETIIDDKIAKEKKRFKKESWKRFL